MHIILLISIAAVLSAEEIKLKPECSNEDIKAFTDSSWGGCSVTKIDYNGSNVCILDNSKTSGIYSSEIFIYILISDNKWKRIGELPFLAVRREYIGIKEGVVSFKRYDRSNNIVVESLDIK